MPRCLLVSASMGSGHDAVAAELARRMSAVGHEARIVDLLALMPAGTGAALRGGYDVMLRAAPWLYEGIYRTFFTPSHPAFTPSTSPAAALARKGVLREVSRFRPDAVVSTFHLAAQVVGGLREQGRLDATCTVLVTDFAVHQVWLHPGNDAFICLHPDGAAIATQRTRRPAHAAGPVVAAAFRDGPTSLDAAEAVRRELGLGRRDVPVLLSTGSWGVGAIRQTFGLLAGHPRYVPLALCGRNERLRSQLARIPGGRALGWRVDVPALMTASAALVENAAGLTCLEAFACRLPVVTYRPIPGHGRDGARVMEAAGLSLYPRTPVALVAALDRVTAHDSDVRQHLVEATNALFARDAASLVFPEPINGAPHSNQGHRGPAGSAAGSAHQPARS